MWTLWQKPSNTGCFFVSSVGLPTGGGAARTLGSTGLSVPLRLACLPLPWVVLDVAVPGKAPENCFN